MPTNNITPSQPPQQGATPVLIFIVIAVFSIEIIACCYYGIVATLMGSLVIAVLAVIQVLRVVRKENIYQSED